MVNTLLRDAVIIDDIQIVNLRQSPGLILTLMLQKH